MKTTEVTAEAIHREVENAQEELMTSLSQIIGDIKVTEVTDEVRQKALLPGLGFFNSESSVASKKIIDISKKESDKKKSVVGFSEIMNNLILKHSKRGKFITYPQMEEILRKYNLYVAPSKYFLGKMPIKNINEIAAYKEVSVKKVVKTDGVNLAGTGYYHHSNDSNETMLSGACSNDHERLRFFVIAPATDFMKTNNSDSRVAIGRELCYVKKPRFVWAKIPEIRIDDPIVVCPYFVKQRLVLQVVTKWGEEAKYEEF